MYSAFLSRGIKPGRSSGLLLMAVLLFNSVQAHTVVNELENLRGSEAAWMYLKLGYTHILPMGLDHILFVLSLFLLNPKLKPVMWQATAFTVAHSVTLGLAMYHLINPPLAWVEPLISASIVYVAMENIISPQLKPGRIAVVFFFGLVHGLGFAGALGQMGLPPQAYLFSLVAFNLGVELGQLTIILSAWFLIARWMGPKPFYRRRVVVPFSTAIAVVAGVWTIQRIFT
jgi:hypothetical protein